MPGERLSLTDRDQQLLSEVNRFGVMTREQLIRIGLFASKTRANDRLHRLTKAGYLSSIRQPLQAGGPMHVYTPGPALKQSRQVRRHLYEGSALFLRHQLGLVDIRIGFEQHTKITRVLTDKDLSEYSFGFIPDAYLEYEVAGLTYCAFVEYDRGTEPLSRIEQKVQAYLKLAFSGRFQKLFGFAFFRALLITESAGRQAGLSKAAVRMTDKVMRITTLPALRTHGPLASIWYRPGSTTPESLLSN